MSDDEFEMRMIERRNRQRLIEKGVRYEPIQKGFLPNQEPNGVEQQKYYGKKIKRGRK